MKFLVFNIDSSLESDESHFQSEQIRIFGYVLLALWAFVICYITKEYWFPVLFKKKLAKLEKKEREKLDQQRKRREEEFKNKKSHDGYTSLSSSSSQLEEPQELNPSILFSDTFEFIDEFWAYNFWCFNMIYDYILFE